MLAYANDFWPLFWTIIGAGALLTIPLTAALGKVRRPHTDQVALAPAGAPAAGNDHQGIRAAA